MPPFPISNRNDEKESILKILNNKDYFESFKPSSKNIMSIAKDTEILKKYPYSWSMKILEAYLYLKIQNKGRPFEIIRKLLNTNPLAGENFLYGWSDKERDLLGKRLNKAFTELIKNLESPILLSLIQEYFSLYFQESETEEYIDNLEGFSATDLNILSKNPIWGSKFPVIWYPILNKRISSSFAQEYMENTHYFYHRLKKKDSRMIFLLEKFSSSENKIKVSIEEALMHLMKSKKLSDKENFFSLMDSSSFRNKYSHVVSTSLGERRRFFQRQLQKGKSPEYNLYQLIRLGDFNPHYLGFLK